MRPQWFGRYSSSYLALLVLLFGVAALVTFAQFRPIRPWLVARKRRLGVLAAASLAALATAELAVRLVDPLGISYFERAAQYYDDRVADSDLGVRHRRNFRAVYGGVEYAYNELGLRDPPIAAKRADERRVLVLGDSVTLGSGVAAASTFCRRLEAMTRDTARPLRVINAGVGGYNTTQELAFLRRHGDELAPDALLLVYVYNDVEPPTRPADPNAAGFRGKSPPQVVEMLLGYSWIYRIFVQVERSTAAEAERVPRSSPDWQASMRALRSIAAWARGRHLPFGVVYFASLHDPATDEELFEELGLCAVEEGFPLVDSTVWFGQLDPARWTNSVVDSHPDHHGHQRIAEGILDFLRTTGLVDR